MYQVVCMSLFKGGFSFILLCVLSKTEENREKLNRLNDQQSKINKTNFSNESYSCLHLFCENWLCCLLHFMKMKTTGYKFHASGARFILIQNAKLRIFESLACIRTQTEKELKLLCRRLVQSK